MELSCHSSLRTVMRPVPAVRYLQWEGLGSMAVVTRFSDSIVKVT
jgi:hypothetical protein